MTASLAHFQDCFVQALFASEPDAGSEIAALARCWCARTARSHGSHLTRRAAHSSMFAWPAVHWPTRQPQRSARNRIPTLRDFPPRCLMPAHSAALAEPTTNHKKESS